MHAAVPSSSLPSGNRAQSGTLLSLPVQKTDMHTLVVMCTVADFLLTGPSMGLSITTSALRHELAGSARENHVGEFRHFHRPHHRTWDIRTDGGGGGRRSGTQSRPICKSSDQAQMWDECRSIHTVLPFSLPSAHIPRYLTGLVRPRYVLTSVM